MSLTITISGVYLDPEAQPLPGVTLVFETVYNSAQTQLQTTVKTVTDDSAAYLISLVPDVYSVSEVNSGRKKWLGNIQIFADSVPGTLNEYLTSFQPDQYRPGILAEMEEILEETKTVAANAGVVPCGTYSAATQYVANDLVEFDGSEYRATADTMGVAPPASPWELFVSAGAQGEQGEKGEKGDTGEQGKTGDPGPANTLTIGTVTTLPAGSSATAEITGDAPNQTLNLSIPQGAQGESGSIVIPDLNTTGCNLCAVTYSNFNPGDEASGSAIHYGSVRTVAGVVTIGEYTTKNLSGTWRCQGYVYLQDSGQAGFASFVRIDTDAEGLLTAANYAQYVRNPVYSNADGSLIDCEVFYRGAWHPFTADPNDPQRWGREIYAAAVAGELGDVAAYIEPE